MTDQTTTTANDEEQTKFFIPIAKASNEEQTVTGVVLRPETVDGQGDIMDSAVIRRAAHRFLADYNKQTKLGLMHNDFKPQFELYESYLAPMDLVIGNLLVPAGSWIVTIHIISSKIWAQIKEGKLTGFSIGGKARVQKLEQTKAVL